MVGRRGQRQNSLSALGVYGHLHQALPNHLRRHGKRESQQLGLHIELLDLDMEEAVQSGRTPSLQFLSILPPFLTHCRASKRPDSLATAASGCKMVVGLQRIARKRVGENPIRVAWGSFARVPTEPIQNFNSLFRAILKARPLNKTNNQSEHKI